MKLTDQVAVVTGASAGIGRAIAKLYVQQGAKVIGIGNHNMAGVESLVDETQHEPGEMTAFHADVSQRQDVEKMLDLALDKYGRLDILVNNAGVLDKMTPVGELEDSLWEMVISIDLNGVMYACRRAVQIMQKQQRGVILNMSSVCGVQGGRGGAAYTAAKHAIVGLSKNIGSMYADQGIRCNVLCPGSVLTDMTTKGMDDANKFGLEKAIAGLKANHRAGTPEEIASIALFLVSEEAKFINGAAIIADSGWCAY